MKKSVKETFECDYDNPRSVAAMLHEYNLWRRGRGKYKWQDNPMKNKELKFSSRELGLAIDVAVVMLKAYAKLTERTKKITKTSGTTSSKKATR